MRGKVARAIRQHTARMVKAGKVHPSNRKTYTNQVKQLYREGKVRVQGGLLTIEE